MLRSAAACAGRTRMVSAWIFITVQPSFHARTKLTRAGLHVLISGNILRVGCIRRTSQGQH